MSKKLFSAPFIAFLICGTADSRLRYRLLRFYRSQRSFYLGECRRDGDGQHMKALGLSLLLAFVSTVICLLLAFPLGMILKGTKLGKKGFMIFVFILPMWMNFLLRTMAWQVLLEKNGIINSFLAAIGLPRLAIINTSAAVVLGMVYDYLPFMVLPDLQRDRQNRPKI